MAPPPGEERRPPRTRRSGADPPAGEEHSGQASRPPAGTRASTRKSSLEDPAAASTSGGWNVTTAAHARPSRRAAAAAKPAEPEEIAAQPEMSAAPAETTNNIPPDLQFMLKINQSRGAGKRQVKVPQQPLINIPTFGAEDEDSDFEMSEREEDAPSDSGSSEMSIDDDGPSAKKSRNELLSGESSDEEPGEALRNGHVGKPSASDEDTFSDLDNIGAEASAESGRRQPLICSVCLLTEGQVEDFIVQCDRCGVSVHEGCYGDYPEDDDHSSLSSGGSDSEPWFCAKCLARLSQPPACELCPNVGGIYRQTDDGRWIHAVCGLYIPHVTYGEVDRLDAACLSQIPHHAWGARQCAFCEDVRFSRTGITIQCDAGRLCKTFYHPTCGQRVGFLVEPEQKESNSQDSEESPACNFFSYCKLHTETDVLKLRQKTYKLLLTQISHFAPNGSLKVERRFERAATRYLNSRSEIEPWVPPMPVPRLLSTRPETAKMLAAKAKIFGLDREYLSSGYVDISNKWHISPALNTNFPAYFHDRESRISEMQNSLLGAVNENRDLKDQLKTMEKKLRKITYMVDGMEKLVDVKTSQMVEATRHLHQITGREYSLPITCTAKLDLLSKKVTAKPATAAAANHQPKRAQTQPAEEADDCGASALPSNEPQPLVEIVLKKCNICQLRNNQHLIIECISCKLFFHINCLDPPLSRVPRPGEKWYWQCPTCTPDTSKVELIEEKRTRRKTQLFTHDKPEKKPEKTGSAADTDSQDETGSVSSLVANEPLKPDSELKEKSCSRGQHEKSGKGHETPVFMKPPLKRNTDASVFEFNDSDTEEPTRELSVQESRTSVDEAIAAENTSEDIIPEPQADNNCHKMKIEGGTQRVPTTTAESPEITESQTTDNERAEEQIAGQADVSNTPDIPMETADIQVAVSADSVEPLQSSITCAVLEEETTPGALAGRIVDTAGAGAPRQDDQRCSKRVGRLTAYSTPESSVSGDTIGFADSREPRVMGNEGRRETSCREQMASLPEPSPQQLVVEWNKDSAQLEHPLDRQEISLQESAASNQGAESEKKVQYREITKILPTGEEVVVKIVSSQVKRPKLTTAEQQSTSHDEQTASQYHAILEQAVPTQDDDGQRKKKKKKKHKHYSAEKEHSHEEKQKKTSPETERPGRMPVPDPRSIEGKLDQQSGNNSSIPPNTPIQSTVDSGVDTKKSPSSDNQTFREKSVSPLRKTPEAKSLKVKPHKPTDISMLKDRSLDGFDDLFGAAPKSDPVKVKKTKKREENVHRKKVESSSYLSAHQLQKEQEKHGEPPKKSPELKMPEAQKGIAQPSETVNPNTLTDDASVSSKRTLKSFKIPKSGKTSTPEEKSTASMAGGKVKDKTKEASDPASKSEAKPKREHVRLFQTRKKVEDKPLPPAREIMKPLPSDLIAPAAAVAASGSFVVSKLSPTASPLFPSAPLKQPGAPANPELQQKLKQKLLFTTLTSSIDENDDDEYDPTSNYKVDYSTLENLATHPSPHSSLPPPPSHSSSAIGRDSKPAAAAPVHPPPPSQSAIPPMPNFEALVGELPPPPPGFNFDDFDYDAPPPPPPGLIVYDERLSGAQPPQHPSAPPFPPISTSATASASSSQEAPSSLLSDAELSETLQLLQKLKEYKAL